MKTLFTVIYFLAMVVQIIIRAPIDRKRRQNKLSERRVTTQENVLFGLLTVGNFLLPLLYAVTPWLNFANYTLPAWMGWLGALVMIGGLVVFWRGHMDLGVNWSPSLEIREQHTLITNGIYGMIRHPMYASQWLWCIAQILLIQNWLAGPIGFLLFIPFYLLRVQAEERLMLDTFGEEYQAYMNRTGGVLPRFGK